MADVSLHDGSMILISPDGKTTTIPAQHNEHENPRQKGNTNGNNNEGRP